MEIDDHIQNIIDCSNSRLTSALATVDAEGARIAHEEVIENAETVEEHTRAADRLRNDIRNVGSLLSALHAAAKAHELLAVAKGFKERRSKAR